jgi:hypothetical protein
MNPFSAAVPFKDTILTGCRAVPQAVPNTGRLIGLAGDDTAAAGKVQLLNS